MGKGKPNNLATIKMLEEARKHNNKLLEKCLNNGGFFDTKVSNGDGTSTITRWTMYRFLDGSENWVEQYPINQNTAPGKVRMRLSHGAPGITSLQASTNQYFASNHPTSTASETWNGTREGVCIDSIANNEDVDYYSEAFSTPGSLNAFKQFLSKNPIILQYKTDNPYTETVIDNQPIHIANQRENFYWHEEWRKGLNILSFKNVSFTKNGLTFVCSSRGTITVNGTSTSVTNLYPTATELGEYSMFPAGTFSCGVAKEGTGNFNFVRFTDEEDTYQLSDILTFTFKSSFSLNLIQFPAGTYNNYVVKFMLNTGNVVYPPELYFGSIVRQSEVPIYYTTETISPAAIFGGTWKNLGGFTVGNTTINAWERI